MTTQTRPHDAATEISAEKARGGEIILRKRWQRVVFIAGLAGSVLLALVWAVATA